MADLHLIHGSSRVYYQVLLLVRPDFLTHKSLSVRS